jgi:hypothetical protein
MKIRFLAPLGLLVLAASGLAQQPKPTIVAEGGGVNDYGSTRVLYWNTKSDSSAGQFAINYGRPGWKKDYEDPAKFDPMTKGKVWRMGKNFWTSLDTCLPLKIAGKSVAPGYYYLGLQRSPDGAAWSLAFIDPAKVRSAHGDAFEIQKAKVEFTAPMTAAKAEGETEAQKLTVTFSYGKKNPRKVTLKVAWGNLALTAPIEATVPE